MKIINGGYYCNEHYAKNCLVCFNQGEMRSMTKEQEEKIEKDIRENVSWLVDGKLVELPDGAISTIMAIIRVNLG